MSVYATEADLDEAWGRAQVDLMSVDAQTLDRDSAKIASALNSAAAIVNGYISRRYRLPLLLTDDGAMQLRALTCDVAFCRLATSADRMTEIIQKRHDAAIKQLLDIAQARADVSTQPDPTDPGGASSAGPISPNEAVIIAPERRFTRQTLRDM